MNLRKKAAKAATEYQPVAAIAARTAADAVWATLRACRSEREPAVVPAHLKIPANVVPAAPALGCGTILQVPVPIPAVAQLAAGAMRPQRFAAAAMLVVAPVPWRSKPD